MNEIKEPKSMDMGLEELADPEVQEAIAVLIRKLPRIKDAVLAAEQGVDLATSILQDKESLDGLFERLGQQCAPYRIDKESVLALFALIEKMPKLLKYVNAIEQVADFVEGLGQDKSSQEYVWKGMKGYFAPVTDQVENGVAVFREAKERASHNHDVISIFGLLRLLKDPTVQKTLRFTQSLLEVLSEKSSK